jgi:hypothetical protein
VLGEERCLPAWTRRRDVGGRFVRRARRVVRVEIVVEGGRVRGIVLWPEMFLMKTCIVSSSEEDVEDVVLETLVRRIEGSMMTD